MVFKIVNRLGKVHNELAMEIREVEHLLRKERIQEISNIRAEQDKIFEILKIMTRSLDKITSFMENMTNAFSKMS